MKLPFSKIARKPGLARILLPFSLVLLLAFLVMLALLATR